MYGGPTLISIENSFPVVLSTYLDTVLEALYLFKMSKTNLNSSENESYFSTSVDSISISSSSSLYSVNCCPSTQMVTLIPGKSGRTAILWKDSTGAAKCLNTRFND